MVFAKFTRYVTEEIDDEEISIVGYDMIRCNSEKRSTGGVLMYIRKDVKYKIIVNNCWVLGIKIMGKRFNGVLIGTYHSPSSSDSEFVKFIENICEMVGHETECVCVGDFNIDFNKVSYYSKKLRYIYILYLELRKIHKL